MASLETGLQEVLMKELFLVEDLLTIAYQQTEALKKDDLERIAELTQKQEGLASRLEELEARRVKKLAAFARERSMANPPTLSELLEDKSLSGDFRETARLLWDKFHLLKEQQELNQMLINQSLQYTRKMLSVFNQGAIYQPNGTLEQLQPSSALLDKSV